MVAGLDRKNCWTIAEHPGAITPDVLQHLIAGVSGTPTRSATIDTTTSSTPSATPDAIRVVDETGDVKKGVHKVGAQRQYSGTAGRIENSQGAVYLTYAPGAGMP